MKRSRLSRISSAIFGAMLTCSVVSPIVSANDSSAVPASNPSSAVPASNPSSAVPASNPKKPSVRKCPNGYYLGNRLDALKRPI